MKWKSLFVISLVVLGSSFAWTQTFGFESSDHVLYCNYEQLYHPKPRYGPDVWQGVDNLSPCYNPLNGAIVGVGGGLTKTQNPAGFAVKGVAYADNVYDAFSPYPPTGYQWFVVTNLKCSSHRYGWIGLASGTGIIFGDNYGYLSCKIPGRNGAVASNRLTTGAYAKVPAGK
jgi:hypothetical protein